MEHDGVALSWQPSTDNVMVSYYEVFRNGAPAFKVSIGEYYFDPKGTLSDKYQVRAVDGDGNASELVEVK